MDSEIKIKCITYNVGDKSADQVKPHQMFEFLNHEQNDFVFIGLQELVNDESWTDLIKSRFKKYDYVLFKVRNIWAMWLYALVKRKHLNSVTNVESEVTASGYAGVLGNKGGVSIRLKYQTISICVVNAHFTAHAECYKDRLNDYLDIISNQSFRDEEVENILDHDLVMWMGDLNFRLEDLSKQEIERRINENDFKYLWKHDQLIRAIDEHSIFKNFKEGPLNFRPTFKFDDDCDVYDTSKKQRKPAWTDRILCMSHDDACSKTTANLHSVLLEDYSSCEMDRGSDHRPVTALFRVQFNDGHHEYAVVNKLMMPIQFDKVTGVWNGQKDEHVKYTIRLNNSLLTNQCDGSGVGTSVKAGISNMVPGSATHDSEDGNCGSRRRTENDDESGSGGRQDFKIETWDWIALLPADWVYLLTDFITYSYVQGNQEPNETAPKGNETLTNLLSSATMISRTVALGGRSIATDADKTKGIREPELVAEVEFSRKYLQDIKPNQALQLVYFSRFKNCIQGYSDVFYSK